MEEESVVVRGARGFFALVVVTVAVAIAWLISTWIMGTRIDNELVDLSRDFIRSLSDAVDLDPMIMVIVVPFLIFVFLVGLVVYFIWRQN